MGSVQLRAGLWATHAVFGPVITDPRAADTTVFVSSLSHTRTLYTMAKHSGLVDPITKDFERSTVAYCVDAISISIGSLLGISPVTAFIESAVCSLRFFSQ